MAIGRINATLSGVQPGGLAKIVPTSVAVGSGSGSVDANGNITFSSTTSLSVNGCFTSAYQNYKIVFNFNPSDNDGMTLRLRLSGTDATGSTDYKWSTLYMNGTTVANNGGSSTGTNYAIFSSTSTSNGSRGSWDIFSPNQAIPTSGVCTRTYTTLGEYSHFVHTVSTAYDGFTIAGGAFTGTIRIYGYAQ
jgi:hypothetical protein